MKPKEVRHCETCGKELTGSQRKFCSQEHKNEHWRKRYRSASQADTAVGDSEELQALWRSFVRLLRDHRATILKLMGEKDV